MSTWHGQPPPRTAATLVAPGVLLGLACLLLGAISPIALLAFLALILLGASVAFAFAQPQWSLLLIVGLVYSYGSWVFSHNAGFVDITPLALAGLFAVLLVRRSRYGEPLVIPRETALIVLLIAIWSGSLVFAGDRAVTQKHLIEAVGWALMAVEMMILFDSAAWLRRLAWAIVVGATALAGIAVLQQVTRNFGFEYWGFAVPDESTFSFKALNGQAPVFSGFVRSNGPLQSNPFAQMLMIGGVLAFYLAVGEHERRVRRLAAGCCALIAAGVVCTGSRGGLIAFAAVFVMILLLGPVPRWKAATIVVGVLVVGAVALPSSITSRFASVTSVANTGVKSSGDPAIRGRGSENVVGLRMLADHPVAGVGLGNYPDRYLEYSQSVGIDPRSQKREPHNLYLEVAAETGLLGMTSFLLLLGVSLSGPWRARAALTARRDQLVAEGLLVAMLAYLAAGIFLHAVYPRYLWLVVGLGLTAGQVAARSRRA